MIVKHGQVREFQTDIFLESRSNLWKTVVHNMAQKTLTNPKASNLHLHRSYHLI